MTSPAIDISKLIPGNIDTTSENFNPTREAFDIISKNEEIKKQYLKFRAAVITLAYAKFSDNKMKLKNFYEKVLVIVEKGGENHRYLPYSNFAEEEASILNIAINNGEIDEGVLSRGMKGELQKLSKLKGVSLAADMQNIRGNDENTSDIMLKQIVGKFRSEESPFRKELAGKYVRHHQGAPEKDGTPKEVSNVVERTRGVASKVVRVDFQNGKK